MTTALNKHLRIPAGWHIVPLGEVARIEFSSVDKKSVDGEEPVELCNYTDVFYNRQIHSEMEFMAATATTRELERWSLKQGDVLFTKDSETRTEIGIPAYVTEDLPDVLCGYHLGRARPRSETIYGSYLAESLRSPMLSRQFARIANGVTRFGLTLAATRGLTLPLPPLGEQRAIAEILDSIEDTIEQTDRVIAATERLRDALVHELLTKGIPGWHTEWKEHPTLGTIPTDRKVVLLGHVSDPPTYGANTPALPWKKGATRYVRITDITEDGRLKTDDPRSADPEAVKGYELGTGEVLFARSGSVGRTYLYRAEDGPCTYAGYLIRFRPRPETALPKFVTYFTRSQAYKRWVRSMTRVGAQPNINASEYAACSIPLPQYPEQVAIANVLDSVDNTIERRGRERAALAVFKESMAEVLLTGRVRVPCAV